MPRVVYVAESFNAGVLAAVKLMAWEMHRRGWAITVVHGRRAESPTEVRDLFPPGTMLREVAWGQAIRPARELAVIRTLRRVFSEQRPDIIHLVSSKAGAAGRVAAWPSFRGRVAYSPQGWSFLVADRSVLGRSTFWLMEWLLALLGGTIVACSNGEREAGLALTGRIVLIENALPEVPAAAQLSSRLVGTIGRICAQKDPAFFVEVVRAVARRDSGVRFVWVGDGEQRPLLEQARAEGLPITMTGWIPPNEVTTRLREWSVFLLTSRYEGMPFAILEALASGVPVVGRDAIGNRDTIRDGVTGTLFRAPDEAASAILRYLEDQPLRISTGLAAQHEAATRFAPGRLGDELEAVYRRLAR